MTDSVRNQHLSLGRGVDLKAEHYSPKRPFRTIVSPPGAVRVRWRKHQRRDRPLPAPLSLALNVERTPPAPDLEIRPRHVKRWIDSQPREVTFETGRTLCRHLAATNRAAIEVDARMEILEAHRPAAAPILEELEALYAKAPLPLAPGPRAALGLAREFLTELALGHRIAAVDVGRKLLATKKQTGTLMMRAMHYTAGRLFAAYKSYTPVPAGTWAELHELYIGADSQGVARQALDTDPKLTIAGLYAEALLLSLTDPYRLVHGEAERVLQVLREHRGLATLGQSRPATRPGGHFVVPCNTDRPPKPSIAKLDDTGGPDWRLLDANPIVDQLSARREAIERGAAKAPKAQHELLAKLTSLWGDPPKRTSRRDPGQATVAIAMGMEGVGHFVSLEPRIDLVREDDMLRRGITMPLAPLPLDDQSEPLPVFEYEVVNESRGGLRVRRLGRTDQPIVVGEVAGIKLHGKPHWAIGAVRWVTVFEDGGMEFGLQYLAPLARFVTVAAWGAPSGPGLLLGTEEGSASLLLTSPRAFSHLKELEVVDAGDARLVYPAGVVELTARFEVFRLKAP
jgi:cyclic-di-GMP-binding protein